MLKTQLQKKYTIIYCSFTSIILDFNKPKAWNIFFTSFKENSVNININLKGQF